MPIVTSKKMFADAYAGGYAIGAFNVNNMEIIQGITEAAKELKAPLILQVSSGARKYANHTYLTGSMLERLLEIIKRYDVNVIEVVGHTDEQRVSGERVSNLDKTLFPSLQSKAAPPAPEASVAADNAGLGLARAVSVVRVLSNDTRLSRLRILPLSGAQLIDLGDKLAAGVAPGAVKERRRIEIRVRRSDK